ncbi:hypothetical protein [Nonomuraea rubra]|uniref:hypothetical protein n=1 Tax=Nonomuraea rubra TaxID=46180 RepID=UPI0031E6382C
MTVALFVVVEFEPVAPTAVLAWAPVNTYALIAPASSPLLGVTVMRMFVCAVGFCAV